MTSPRLRAALLFGAGLALAVINGMTFLWMDGYYPMAVAVIPLCLLWGAVGLVRPGVMKPWREMGSRDRVLQSMGAMVGLGSSVAVALAVW